MAHKTPTFEYYQDQACHFVEQVELYNKGRFVQPALRYLRIACSFPAFIADHEAYLASCGVPKSHLLEVHEKSVEAGLARTIRQMSGAYLGRWGFRRPHGLRPYIFKISDGLLGQFWVELNRTMGDDDAEKVADFVFKSSPRSDHGIGEQYQSQQEVAAEVLGIITLADKILDRRRYFLIMLSEYANSQQCWSPADLEALYSKPESEAAKIRLRAGRHLNERNRTAFYPHEFSMELIAKLLDVETSNAYKLRKRGLAMLKTQLDWDGDQAVSL